MSRTGFLLTTTPIVTQPLMQVTNTPSAGQVLTATNSTTLSWAAVSTPAPGTALSTVTIPTNQVVTVNGTTMTNPSNYGSISVVAGNHYKVEFATWYTQAGAVQIGASVLTSGCTGNFYSNSGSNSIANAAGGASTAFGSGGTMSPTTTNGSTTQFSVYTYVITIATSASGTITPVISSASSTNLTVSLGYCVITLLY